MATAQLYFAILFRVLDDFTPFLHGFVEYENRLLTVTMAKNEMQKDLESKIGKLEISTEHLLTAKAADSLVILELRKQWTEHKCPSVEPILHAKSVLENLLSEKMHYIEQLESDFNGKSGCSDKLYRLLLSRIANN
ncbi:hypothetical protein AHF37_00329 [Paragonimus kellicotti]|nr:hypothetical protein AHF37_00329 [Paragonimus kellicotti]